MKFYVSALVFALGTGVGYLLHGNILFLRADLLWQGITSNGAAWLQAFGAVGAVGAVSFVARREHMRAEHERAERIASQAIRLSRRLDSVSNNIQMLKVASHFPEGIFTPFKMKPILDKHLEIIRGGYDTAASIPGADTFLRSLEESYIELSRITHQAGRKIDKNGVKETPHEPVWGAAPSAENAEKSYKALDDFLKEKQSGVRLK